MSSTQEPATLVCHVFFCGNCAPRPAWLLVGREDNRFLAPMYPDPAPSRGRCPYGELMLEPGEGWVTKPSRLTLDTLDLGAPQLDDRLLPLASYFFLCERQDPSHLQRELPAQPVECPTAARLARASDAAARTRRSLLYSTCPMVGASATHSGVLCLSKRFSRLSFAARLRDVEYCLIKSVCWNSVLHPSYEQESAGRCYAQLFPRTYLSPLARRGDATIGRGSRCTLHNPWWSSMPISRPERHLSGDEESDRVVCNTTNSP